MIRPVALALAILAAVVPVASTQVPVDAPRGGSLRVELGVEPRQVTVGEHFLVAVSVDDPLGGVVEYLPIARTDEFEPVDEPRIATSAAGAAVAVYPMVAWVAIPGLVAEVPIRHVDVDGAVRIRTVRVQLPEVVSVLPPPDVQIEPRPTRGVVVSAHLDGLAWWWWLLLLLGTLAAAVYGWRKLRTDPVVEPETPAADPRVWALARLEEISDSELRGGRFAEVHQRVSWVLRVYLARVDPTLGTDLTTTELVGTIRSRPHGSIDAEALASVLDSADRVKFARHPAAEGEADRLVRDARVWVGSFSATPGADQAPGRAA